MENESSFFEVFKTTLCWQTLSLKTSRFRKNGKHQLNSFLCHTINHTASDYRSYAYDLGEMQLSVPAFWAHVISTKLLIFLQALNDCHCCYNSV